MESLGQGVHRISVGSNAYLVDGDDGVVLVDTGIPGRMPQIRDSLRGLGRGVEDLRAVLVTHAHPDHVGSAAAVVDAGGRPVCMSHRDAAVARGDAPIEPPPMMDLLGPLKVLFALVPRPDPVSVDHEVTEVDRSGWCEACSTAAAGPWTPASRGWPSTSSPRPTSGTADR